MRYLRIIPVLSAVGIAACAFTPHEVAVNASAPVEPSSIGAGRTIYLEVIDDRETEVVGQRGAGMQGADITASQVMPTLERELIAGFTAKGFSVSTTDRNAAFTEVLRQIMADDALMEFLATPKGVS